MEQDVFTNKEEQTIMSEKESQKTIDGTKEKIKVNYDGSGIYGLTILSKLCFVFSIISLILAFVTFVDIFVEPYNDVIPIIFIVSLVVAIENLILLPIIKGYRTLVKNARYQSALLEKDYDFE